MLERYLWVCHNFLWRRRTRVSERNTYLHYLRITKCYCGTVKMMTEAMLETRSPYYKSPSDKWGYRIVNDHFHFLGWDKHFLFCVRSKHEPGCWKHFLLLCCILSSHHRRYIIFYEFFAFLRCRKEEKKYIRNSRILILLNWWKMKNSPFRSLFVVVAHNQKWKCYFIHWGVEMWGLLKASSWSRWS